MDLGIEDIEKGITASKNKAEMADSAIFIDLLKQGFIEDGVFKQISKILILRIRFRLLHFGLKYKEGLKKIPIVNRIAKRILHKYLLKDT